MPKKNEGIVLIVVIVVVLIITITGMAALVLAEQQIILSRIDADKAKAFYLAEAGLAKMQEFLQKPLTSNVQTVLEDSMVSGVYNVQLDTSQNPCYVTATGISGSVTKQIRAEATFLAPAFENAIYAMNDSETDWSLQLRGTGNPVPDGGGGERGGKDIINGNVLVDGDAFLFEESAVNPAPAPNPYGLNGDVEATGDISVQDSADIAGSTTSNSGQPDIVDLTSMDYATNNTHDVGQIFNDAGVSSGSLPNGNDLRDVFVKNPSDRSTECGTTSGNDYFFEPSSGFEAGTKQSGGTSIDAGQDRIYYIDGDVWVHSKKTYGFNMKGKVTIVATGDIHISDNIEYDGADSMLGLVALGKYDDSDNLVSGGNIYLGDPRYGTMYNVSSMMFAANNFHYNTDSVTNEAAEPETGFTVNGNFAAMGQVSIERDWYSKRTGSQSYTPTPASYNPETNKWVDSETGKRLSQTEIGTIRHYQMVVNYDSRVRDPETQPSGLPKGGLRIFAGFSNWEEL